MSLKAFHILFITLSTALGLGFAVWCFRYASGTNHALYWVFGGLSLAGAAWLPLYGARFLRKMKHVGFF